MVKPHFVPSGAPTLKALPVRKNRVFGQLVLEGRTVTLCKCQVKEWRVGIELISRTHNSYIRVPIFLKWQHVREMSLVDPGARVGDTLSLEAAELECHVGSMFDDHVWACGSACRILKILAHQGISTARICGVHYSHLFLTDTGGISSLRTKEQIFISLISAYVARSQQWE